VSERVRIGKVGKPHGLDGAFVVEDASNDPRWFKPGAVLLVPGGEATVVVARRTGGRPVIRLDRTVQRGTPLEVERSQLPPTEDGEFYVFELVGLEVLEEPTGRSLGRVVTVQPGVANDILQLDGGLLLPMVEDCVLAVDIAAGRILVASGFSEAP
jgi:16S rRNA processing protein RimM